MSVKKNIAAGGVRWGFVLGCLVAYFAIMLAIWFFALPDNTPSGMSNTEGIYFSLFIPLAFVVFFVALWIGKKLGKPLKD